MHSGSLSLPRFAIEWSSLEAQARFPQTLRPAHVSTLPDHRTAAAQRCPGSLCRWAALRITDVDPFVQWRSRRELKRFAGSISFETVSQIIDHHQTSFT